MAIIHQLDPFLMQSHNLFALGLLPSRGMHSPVLRLFHALIATTGDRGQHSRYVRAFSMISFDHPDHFVSVYAWRLWRCKPSFLVGADTQTLSPSTVRVNRMVIALIVSTIPTCPARYGR